MNLRLEPVIHNSAGLSSVLSNNVAIRNSARTQKMLLLSSQWLRPKPQGHPQILSLPRSFSKHTALPLKHLHAQPRPSPCTAPCSPTWKALSVPDLSMGTSCSSSVTSKKPSLTTSPLPSHSAATTFYLLMPVSTHATPTFCGLFLAMSQTLRIVPSKQ